MTTFPGEMVLFSRKHPKGDGEIPLQKAVDKCHAVAMRRLRRDITHVIVPTGEADEVSIGLEVIEQDLMQPYSFGLAALDEGAGI